MALHDVPDARQFCARLQQLCDRFEVVSLEELFCSPPSRRVQVAITFDDGYESIYTTAAPVLADLGIPAVFFVCSGFIGAKNEDERVSFVRERIRRSQALRPLSVSQLQELSREPLFEIGGHTAHHVDVGALTDRSVLEREILQDKEQIESWIRHPIRWFAYPFGEEKNIRREALEFLRKESGYRAAFTIVPGDALDSDPYAVPRHSLDPADPWQVWFHALSGTHEVLYKLKRTLRRKSTPGRARDWHF